MVGALQKTPIYFMPIWNKRQGWVSQAHRLILESIFYVATRGTNGMFDRRERGSKNP